jgi:hypothetical protein
MIPCLRQQQSTDFVMILCHRQHQSTDFVMILCIRQQPTTAVAYFFAKNTTIAVADIKAVAHYESIFQPLQ